ncbi:MAG: hypothetical protein AAFX79_07030 [Planctomycetota bacterium]
MPVVPSNRTDALAFMEAHAVPWATAATELGLTVEQVTEFATKVSAARTSYDAAIAARNASKAATVTWHAGVDDAVALARELVRQIQTTAKASEEPSAIYAAGEIPPPKEPTPLGPPDAPTDLALTLDSEGRANLRFAGSREGGTAFAIQRRTTGADGSTTDWVDLGTVFERSFVDAQTPSGVASVAYRVRAERVGGVSPYSTAAILPLGIQGEAGQVQLGLADAA